MICPKCHTEYRPGFTECADCKVSLVEGTREDLEDEKNYVKLVPIMQIGNQTDAAVVKSILGGADILFNIKNDGVQNLIGLGAVGFGFNPLTGPMVVEVEEERAEEAKILLADFKES